MLKAHRPRAVTAGLAPDITLHSTRVTGELRAGHRQLGRDRASENIQTEQTLRVLERRRKTCEGAVIIIKTPITNVLDAERRRRNLSERLMPWLLQDKVGALNLLQNVVLKFETLTANYLHNEEEKKNHF